MTLEEREELAYKLAAVEYPDSSWVSLDLDEINRFRVLAQAVIDAGWSPHAPG
jgi:hypothetical protein